MNIVNDYPERLPPLAVTELTDIAGVHRQNTGSTTEMYSQCSTAPRARPYSDDFAVQLSVYGKLLPSQPASIYHGGLWLYLLHLLHRPELPYPRWELSIVQPRPTTYSN